MATSHHGSPQESGELQKLRKQLEKEQELRGKLMDQLAGRRKREYPDGRIGAEDEGELAFAIGSDPEHGIVKIEFGKPVEWVGMPPQQAIELAQMLIRHARAIAKEPLRISLH